MKIAFILLLLLAGNQMAAAQDNGIFEQQRRTMVDKQIAGRDVKDERVLAAMRAVERHLFVPEPSRFQAYADRPLPIGSGQTISQPYIVAYMTEAAQLQASDKVLEIGTGSGYQAAVLAEIVDHVYTIEIIEGLAVSAGKRLKDLGYANVTVKHGDGYAGWPEHAPFDAIIVTAAPPEVPPKLIEQLKNGGRLVIPVGDVFQELLRITKTEGGVKEEKLLPVRFVPMVGSN